MIINVCFSIYRSGFKISGGISLRRPRLEEAIISAGDLDRILHGCVARSWSGSFYCRCCGIARRLLGLAPSYSEIVACAWARVLLVSQQRFPLGLRE